MIWDHPWLINRMGGAAGPPPYMPLAPGQRFAVVTDISEAWITLVGTAWTAAEARQRLVGAYIPCLWSGDDLVGTCVLRCRGSSWILETLKAPGYGTVLLYRTFEWLYRRNPDFALAYTWELGLPGLTVAWWRGWLASATEIQYGWIWMTEGCGFCPSGYHRPHVLPVTIDGAIVSDSGLGDGWGYVLGYTGKPDWAVVAKRWRGLWMRASQRPVGWSWSGEFVVVGSIGSVRPWITSEIAPG